MRYRAFIGGYGLGLLTISACATAFPWKYYATDMPTSCYDQGKLLGKSGTGGWPDLTLDQCKPDPEPSPGSSPITQPVELKCMTMLVADFTELKADDEKCHADLNSCQHGAPPN